jgi:Mg-chelatase subunit ChlD
VIKDERTSPSAALAAFGLLSKAQGGTTPLTSSMIKATARLVARAPLKRKILFVVSDGECDNGPSGVRKACDYARRLDVETVALCVDTKPHKGFDLAVECPSHDMTAAGLGVLVTALNRNV